MGSIHGTWSSYQLWSLGYLQGSFSILGSGDRPISVDQVEAL